MPQIVELSSDEYRQRIYLAQRRAQAQGPAGRIQILETPLYTAQKFPKPEVTKLIISRRTNMRLQLLCGFRSQEMSLLDSVVPHR